LLTRWANFYVIAGSAAAALTGLQFVVIAITAQFRLPKMDGGIEAFSSPTVVYFSTVLALSAVLCAPWDGLLGPAAIIAVCGAAGVGYAGRVGWRAWRFPDYQLVLEDWLWHMALPLTAHAMLLGAGLALVRQPTGALFTIAAAALLLLFIGIHNAWDTVTFLVLERLDSGRRDGDRQEPPSA
ncbi:MAG TPA: hypothetical protein VE075_10625, partial [Thermoanaerobaculia bacterium]|nr:hypothetical protein [Thermoanaerobaculia bacterium]